MYVLRYEFSIYTNTMNKRNLVQIKRAIREYFTRFEVLTFCDPDCNACNSSFQGCAVGVISFKTCRTCQNYQTRHLLGHQYISASSLQCSGL